MASPDEEETANLYEAWPDIARCLRIRTRLANNKAIAKMWDLLQALDYAYQSPESWPWWQRTSAIMHNWHCIMVAGPCR